MGLDAVMDRRTAATGSVAMAFAAGCWRDGVLLHLWIFLKTIPKRALSLAH